MKLILITIGIATILPIVLHWSKFRRVARIVAGTTWIFFIAPPIFVLGIMIFHVAMAVLGPPCFMSINYHIGYISSLIQDTEMGGGEEVDRAFEHLKQCKSDKQKLAKRLLLDSDGTIVALGMNVVVEESFDNGDVLLQQHHGDMRWNYYLASNDEYAKFMFILWKMKKGIPLAVSEEEFIEGWSEGYFTRVGLTSPARRKV